MKTATPSLTSQTRPLSRHSAGWRQDAPLSDPPPQSGDCRKQILIVDDDAGVRGSIGEVLVSEAYVVIPAGNGQQALEIAATQQVDLVLLDLNMPVMNGWDTWERLTAEHPLVPIIIFTARPNQVFTALGAGVGALLEKPIDISTLLRTIERLLAEPVNQRLERLAGHATAFYYASAQPQQLPMPRTKEPQSVADQTDEGGM